ncbi:MAG: PAS domain S-box protein, partial [Nodosilinea sp.]
MTLGNRWLRVNHSLCELLGYSEPEMLALTFSYVTHPHDLDNDLIQRQQLLAGEISNYQVEKRYRHKQGHDIWCLLSVTLAQQIGPDRPYFMAQIQNISRYKETESSLQASQAELETLFGAMTDLVMVRDAQGRCLKIAPTRVDNLYRPTQDMLGKTLHETLPQAEADRILGYIQTALATQQAVQGEYSLQLRSKEVHFLANFSPLSSDRVTIVAHDITTRKQTENYSELQNLITQNMAEGVCLLSATDGCIVYANPKFERMFGYELGELTGKHVSILNYPDDDAGGREVAKQILEQIYCNGEYTYEVHNLKKDGTDFWCRATTSLLEHPDYGAVYVAVQADITLEKQARTDICLLQNLALSISEAEDFEAALALILGEVGKTYGWAYGEAWIPDQSQNILRCSPAHYMGSRKQLGHLSLTSLKHFRESTKTFTFASGAGLPGRVWTSRQPEWIVDTAKQPETTFLRQSIAMDFGIGAALGVPIVARGEVLAILIFFKVETAQVDQHLMDNIFAVAAQLNMLMQRKRLEEALFREKELAQVTLQSIGDAVITTDAQGRIQYLNPIAQALTGWSSDAEGLHIRKILAIFNEVTRLPASNPVELALQQEKTVGLESNTVLINRFGDEIAIDDSAAPIRSRDGCVIGAVMVFRDVSQTRTLSKELTWQASHDPLTQLLNRREFGNRLEAAVKSAQHEDHCHVLCYFDLDRFKIVNDTCGHTAGDELLKKVTALFEKHTRKSDTLARLGGDEFALLMHRCSVEPALRVINVLREEVNRFRFTCEGKTFGIGISVGVVLIDA